MYKLDLNIGYVKNGNWDEAKSRKNIFDIIAENWLKYPLNRSNVKNENLMRIEFITRNKSTKFN